MEVRKAWEASNTLKSEVIHVLAAGLVLLILSQLTHHSEFTQLVAANLINLGFVCFVQLKSNGIRGLFSLGDVSVRTFASLGVLFVSAAIVYAIVMPHRLEEPLSLSSEFERAILSGAMNLGLYAVIRIASNLLVGFVMTFLAVGFVLANRFMGQRNPAVNT